MFHHFFNYKRCINYFHQEYDLQRFKYIQTQSLLLSFIIISNDLRSIFLNRSLFNFPLLPTISKILHGSLLWDEFEISRVEDISLGYKGGLDRLDEDVAEKYDPSGVASGRTSQISDRYISLGMNCP